MAKQRRTYIEGKTITKDDALRLFERLKGREATPEERQELDREWARRKPLRPKGRNGGTQ